MTLPTAGLGWVKIYRKVLKSSLWELDDLCVRIFVWLLLSANHEPRKAFVHAIGAEVEVDRGELVTSYASMAEGCRCRDGRGGRVVVPSMKKLRTAINRLEAVNFVEKIRADRYLHLRIENYGLYQSPNGQGAEVGQTKGQTKGQRKGQSKGQRLKGDKAEGLEELTGGAGLEGAEVGADEGAEVGAEQRAGNKKYIRKNQGTYCLEVAEVFEAYSAAVMKVRSKSAARVSKIKARLGEYGREDVLKAIALYKAVLNDPGHYFTHRFPIERFMTPENIDRFLAMEAGIGAGRKDPERDDFYGHLYQ